MESLFETCAEFGKEGELTPSPEMTWQSLCYLTCTSPRLPGHFNHIRWTTFRPLRTIVASVKEFLLNSTIRAYYIVLPFLGIGERWLYLSWHLYALPMECLHRLRSTHKSLTGRLDVKTFFFFYHRKSQLLKRLHPSTCVDNRTLFVSVQMSSTS